MKRFIVQRASIHIALKLDDIAYFYRDKSIVVAVDKDGLKYLCDKNLTALEEKLCKTVFFRANRKFLVNVEYVKSFKSYERVKLSLKLSCACEEPIIISQERAPLFKKWIYEDAN